MAKKEKGFYPLVFRVISKKEYQDGLNEMFKVRGITKRKFIIQLNSAVAKCKTLEDLYDLEMYADYFLNFDKPLCLYDW